MLLPLLGVLGLSEVPGLCGPGGRGEADGGRQGRGESFSRKFSYPVTSMTDCLEASCHQEDLIMVSPKHPSVSQGCCMRGSHH